MANFKAVIFDLDGTLLDTIEDIADSVNCVLGRSGFPTHDIATYKRMVGEGILFLVFCALPNDRRDEASVRKFAEDVRDEYAKRWNKKTKPYEGVPELLDELARRGIGMAVLSNKPDDFTKMSVAGLLGRWKFEEVFGFGDGKPGKPDPALAVEISRRLNIPPREFVFLGDTKTDMQTAKAAGMYPVGALWGFRDVEELRANGAERLIESPGELLELFERVYP